MLLTGERTAREEQGGSNSELGDEAPRMTQGSSGLVALKQTCPQGRAGFASSGTRGEEPEGAREKEERPARKTGSRAASRELLSGA